MQGRDYLLAGAKMRSPGGGGRVPSDSGKGGSPSWRLCIVSVPSATRPESAHKCLVSVGINGRRVNVREYKAFNPVIAKVVTRILIDIKHLVKLGVGGGIVAWDHWCRSIIIF